jgi:hypothetical protein
MHSGFLEIIEILIKATQNIILSNKIHRNWGIP